MEKGNLNPNPEDQGGVAAPNQAGQQKQPVQQTDVNVYDSFKQKKGFKDDAAVVKSYEDSEAGMHRAQNAIDTAKKQLEAAGYIMDETGSISPANAQVGQVDQGQAQGQPAYPQGQPQGQPQAQFNDAYGDPVYDPYTGQPITNQVDYQLSQMPISQRMGFVFNALSQQRDQYQSASDVAEREILASPEAKGFEDDIRKVMAQIPVAQKANKQVWADALLRVKGARYDNDRKNWSNQGVDEFINKEDNQGLPGAGAGTGAGGARLSKEQEGTYQYYAKNHPGMFKDRAHFLKRNSRTGD